MINLINTIKQYVNLTEKDILIIEELFVRKELKIDEYFMKPVSVCNNFAFVEKGLLRHFIINKGEEETFYFSAENNFVCEIESFISRTASNKAIIALEPTIIYSLSYDNLQKFYSRVSTGERFGRLYLESVFMKAVNHIITVHTESAEQRYLKFLSAYKHIEQRIPQYYIASFIGVTPQSLSRIRHQMTGH